MKRTFTPDWRLEREQAVSESDNRAATKINWDEKPSDCTCNYPETRFRNMTGHAPSCPSHKRLYESMMGRDKPTPATVPSMPTPDSGPSLWREWLTYQLAQPQGRESMGRLGLLRDALKRWELMAEDFAGYWTRTTRESGE